MMRIWREAGLPDGVINFIPCAPARPRSHAHTRARAYTHTHPDARLGAHGRRRCDGVGASKIALPHPHLAGVNFVGSTATFQRLWRGVAEHIESHRY